MVKNVFQDLHSKKRFKIREINGKKLNPNLKKIKTHLRVIPINQVIIKGKEMRRKNQKKKKLIHYHKVKNQNFN